MKELHGRGRTGSRGGLLAGGLALAALAAAPHASAQAAQGSACERLASLKLPQTTITSAAEVSAGSFTSAGDGGNGGAARAAALYKTLPAFCRVAGVIKPSPDSNIKFETWMPLAGWNERFQGVGNGGLAGSISYPAMAAALKDGYATGSTDTGHGPEGGMSRLSELLCCLPQVKLPEGLGYRNLFRVIIMQFLDAASFDVRSVKRSCVHIAHPDGRLIPFDTYNLFYRGDLEKTRLDPLRREAELS